jgi:integrase
MPSIAEVFVTVLPSEPVDTTSPYKNVLRPALAEVGLPASRPATTAPDGAHVPAVRGVRLHDL